MLFNVGELIVSNYVELYVVPYDITTLLLSVVMSTIQHKYLSDWAGDLSKVHIMFV